MNERDRNWFQLGIVVQVCRLATMIFDYQKLLTVLR